MRKTETDPNSLMCITKCIIMFPVLTEVNGNTTFVLQVFTYLGTPRRNLLLFLFITGKNDPRVALVGCFDSCIKATMRYLYMFNSFQDSALASVVISTAGGEAPCMGMHDMRDHIKKNHSFVSTAQQSLGTLTSIKINLHLCSLPTQGHASCLLFHCPVSSIPLPRVVICHRHPHHSYHQSTG